MPELDEDGYLEITNRHGATWSSIEIKAVLDYFVRTYEESMPRFAYNKLWGTAKSETTAEDCVQETFGKLMEIKRIRTYDPDRNKNNKPNPFRRWVFTILWNVARDMSKKLNKSPLISPEEVINWSESQKESHRDSQVESDVFAKLQIAVEQLPERDRKVLLLHHVEEKSLDEIREILGLDKGRKSIGRIKSQLFRTRKKIEKAFS